MLSSQLKLSLSYYSDLYDMIVPKDHILRKIRELVDFSFIYDETLWTRTQKADHKTGAADNK